jgi:predicted lactoylglutathione lyase
MAVAPRVSLVTLGVRDVERAEAFYLALGWEVVIAADDGFRLFRTSSAWLTLWPAESLWADAGIPPPAEPRFGGVALAMNLDSRADVDEALAIAEAAGGTVLRPANALEWGMYHGHVADPDGHVWEIAHNPDWEIGPDGRPVVG